MQGVDEQAPRAGAEVDLGQIRRAAGAQIGVAGGQLQLGLQQIGAAAQQGRRQQLRRGGQLQAGKGSAIDRGRVAAGGHIAGQQLQGIELARKEGVDFMLPVGGGSVIDTAKAIAAGVPYEGDFWDFYIGKAKVKKALKVGVVLTIPAAGSEGSGNTVITKLEGLQKLSLRVPELLRPVFAVMNPELTYTLPPYQTACGIADMMVHIMERYFTNTPDVEISDRLCEGTLMAIIKEAYKVKQNPNDYEARANIMWCGTIAHNGTCGVGCEEDWASHFLEHEISAVYNVTHGAGLAVIVPAWMTFMAEHNPNKIARFANRVFGVPENEDLEEMALAGISRLKHFFRYMGLPVNFKELGIEHPDIELLVKKLHENKGELVGNYVKLNKEYSKEIFELACK